MLDRDQLDSTRPWARWTGPILCAGAFVAAAVWSWRKWPDPLIDFGREIYVPWQLTNGRVLYRDLAHLVGPLSKYVQALAMWIGGVSLTSLIVCNLAILAGIVALLYRFVADGFGRLTATVACLTTLSVFAFSQYLVTANYNFVCPYSHEATHGVALSLVMVYCLTRGGELRPWRWVAAGLCLGGVLLTRAEVAVAALGAGLLAIAIHWRGSPPARRWKGPACLGVAALVPIAGFFVYFCTKMPVGKALRGVGGSWTTLAGGGVAGHYFYAHGMGLDAPGTNLMLMFRVTGLLVLGSLVAVGLDRVTRKRRETHLFAAVTVGAMIFTLLTLRPNLVDWSLAGRPLPVLCLAVALIGGAMLLIKRSITTAAGLKPLVIFSAFAFVLTWKMLLAPRLDFAGFYLAMPAAVVFVILFVEVIPRWLARRWGGGGVFRSAALAFIAAGALAHLRYSNAVYETKDFTVGSGGDLFYTQRPQVYPGGLACAEALKKIEEIMPPQATFVALPEGAMLNYLSRRENPTPYTMFSTTELAAYGEEPMLASLRTHPPDYIVLVHKEPAELGVGYFGSDPRFGAKVMQWVRENYVDAALIGYEPLRDRRFGVKIMKRH